MSILYRNVRFVLKTKNPDVLQANGETHVFRQGLSAVYQIFVKKKLFYLIKKSVDWSFHLSQSETKRPKVCLKVLSIKKQTLYSLFMRLYSKLH